MKKTIYINSTILENNLKKSENKYQVEKSFDFFVLHFKLNPIN